MSKKSTPGPSYDGLKKISPNALSVTLFKQPPKAEIWPKFKNFCAYQIANDQTVVMSPENPPKVHSRPKLWAFEKKFPRNLVRNAVALLGLRPSGTDF